MSGTPAHLTSPFTFGGPVLWLARARLFADHLELSGWRLRGRYRRRIPLRNILQVDVPRAEELLLWLSNGQSLRLGIPQAHVWKERLESLIAAQAPLSGQQP